MHKIIDTHAHIEELENLKEALQNARDNGVSAIIAVGSDHISNQKILEISSRYPLFVYPALGLHPFGLDKVNETQLTETIQYIEENIDKIVAIGEIGLDYDKRVIKRVTKERQKEVFKQFLDVAHKYNKPVSIHSRYAWKDCFELVKTTGIKKAVFHWFTGFPSVLKEILDAGYFISGNPAAEYHEEHRSAIKETPMEKLLLETDSPVFYGRENKYRAQPADLVRSLKAVSLLKELPEADIAYRTTNNAMRLFNIID